MLITTVAISRIQIDDFVFQVTMAPMKRFQPAFSPPRPKKAKATTTPSINNVSKRKSATSVSATKSTSIRKPGNRGRKRAKLNSPSDEEDEEENEPSHRGRSVLALVDMQAGVDDDDDDEDEEEEDGDESDEADDAEDVDTTARSLSDESEEEPDMILAEITETIEPPSEPIPEALVHKMLLHHFEKPDKTKLSSDARNLVTKYLEVFVREAIMRSAYEREHRDDNHDNDDGGGGGAGGFLEVEDLERAAVQLCLDF